MSKKRVHKVKLNYKEIDYLNGLIEAQRCKIMTLDSKAKKSEPIKNDLQINENLGKKLAIC